MSGGKKFGISIICFLLFVLITGGLLPVTVSRVVTNREQVKVIVSSKATYDAITKTLVQNGLNNTQADLQANTPQQIDNEALKKLIDKYLSAQNYNRIMTSIVDSTYDWLEGKTEQPKFNITFASNQAEFQQFVTQVFTDRFKSLPPCDTAVDLTTYNPLEATCKPEGYDEAAVSAFINDQAGAPELTEFYKNASVNSNLVYGQIDPSTTDQLRGWYNTLKLAPIIFSLLLALLVGFIFLISFNWRKGLKISAIAILVPSLLSLLSTTMFMILARAIVLPAIAGNNQTAFVPTFNFALGQINNRIILYSAVLSATSVISLVVLHFTKQKAVKATLPDIPAPIKSPAEPKSKEQKP